MMHISFSIVVVGHDCNPTILSPDFLLYQKIVLPEWQWELGSPIMTTPAIAIVTYTNGVSIRVEPKRFQVEEVSKEIWPPDSHIIHVARRYIEVLPHVRYTAVGINFRSFIEHHEAEIYVRKKFLKEGAWINDSPPLHTIAIKLIYPLSNGRLSITVDPGRLQEGDKVGEQEKSGIIINANFHRDCQGYPAHEQVITYLQNVKEDWKEYNTIISRIFGVNDDS